MKGKEQIMVKGKVSCIIASYNTDSEYLIVAVKSILNQSYKKIELIVVDDGSEIPVSSILDGIEDERLKVITNVINMGVTKSRNRALSLIEGEYMAVMDADDISDVTRFEKQVRYLEENHEIDLVSTQMAFISNDRRQNPKIRIPKEPEEYLSWLFWDNSRPFPHGPAMIRVSFLEKYKIQYDEKYKKALDYRLWVDCARHKGKFHILDEYLYYYRIHEGQMSQSGRTGQMYYADQICLDQLEYLHIEPTQEEEKIHLLLRDSDSYQDGREMLEWKEKLIQANYKYQYCNPKIFEKEVNYRFFKMAYKEYLCKGSKMYKSIFIRSCTLYNICRSIKARIQYRFRKRPGYLKV